MTLALQMSSKEEEVFGVHKRRITPSASVKVLQEDDPEMDFFVRDLDKNARSKIPRNSCGRG